MKSTILISSLMIAAGITASADVVNVTSFDYYGPFPIGTPLIIDSLDVNSKNYDPVSALSIPLEKKGVKPSSEKFNGVIAPNAENPSLHLLAFTIENHSYANPSMKVEGLKNHKVFIDGKEAGKNLRLTPASHRVVIKYLSDPKSSDSLRVSLDGKGIDPSILSSGGRMFTLDDVLHGPRISGASISTDGKYILETITTTVSGGKSSTRRLLRESATGNVVRVLTEPVSWMPCTSNLYFTRQGIEGKELVAIEPATGRESVIAENVPDGRLTFTPDERSLIVTSYTEGPKEDKDIYQVIEPDDRQPGWRNRSSLSIYDIPTGATRRLTHGHHSVSLLDIADDSSKILISFKKSRLEKRPTSLTTILSLDLASMKADTIVADDGFISYAAYSPDGKSILASASPEGFGGIGNIVPEGKIPSSYDMQLFLIGADKKIKPLTIGFNPSVSRFTWSRADGMVYFTADNRDQISLYRLDPASGKISQIPMPEDLVKGYSLPRSGNLMAWNGQSAANPDRLYTLDTRRLRSTLLDEPQKDMLANVNFGKVEGWDFVNSRGDTICGRFYLPPNFDPNKKYPLIVNYYGGCTPTARNFESRYPHHAYAAQDYVVYVIEPSGAIGFGQEFSSRHVNTAGQGVAEDIIEGTNRFCEEHPYVDSSKIGCIGASYGGFMTQYLQTVTPMFAAAISHAGISDHTSYWGEGYWGYSYSEVSMADSYPWSHPDLYTRQSPLFNADKINTPLLFLHGDADKNVPVGESIQMFTALKLLGKETAFVAVSDQDHHIMQYDKRKKWQNTIFAWFEKYLKGDSTWWDALYPPKSL